MSNSLGRFALRLSSSVAGVAVVTSAAFYAIPHNLTAVGFAYLLLVLLIASTWGLAESTLASIAAALAYNFFFLPPILKFTIADPQNWIALFSFLATALIASRLSARVNRQALDAIERQRDIERLYTFSRAILLIDPVDPIAKQLARKLAEVFALHAVVLFDRRTGEIHRAGPSDFDAWNRMPWTPSCATPPPRARPSSILSTSASSPQFASGRNPSPVLPSRARSCKTRFCRASVISSPSDWSVPARRI